MPKAKAKEKWIPPWDKKAEEAKEVKKAPPKKKKAKKK